MPARCVIKSENETLKIDLQPEYAVVEVHYRMHNTGAKVQQDFFFPVERWGEQQDSGDEPQGQKPTDIGHYQISVDGQELKWTDVLGAKEKAAQVSSGTFWDENVPVIKSWKKSVIPFERDQTREVIMRYGARYSESDESVSDDEHVSDRVFAYSLSPAATWKGPILNPRFTRGWFAKNGAWVGWRAGETVEDFTVVAAVSAAVRAGLAELAGETPVSTKGSTE